MTENHGRGVMQGPSRHLVAERCTIIRGDDFVAGSLAAYKRGRNPYVKTKFYCPHCRLANVPATPYESKADFRAHVQGCGYRATVGEAANGTA